MSIQRKVISLIVIVFAVYLGLDWLVQRSVVLPSFIALEEDEARRGMERLIQAIERESVLLDTKANDWGTWDDTYRFALDHNEEFRRTNLNAVSLTSLKVNLIGIFDSRRQLIWGMVYDSRSQQPLALYGIEPDLARSVLTNPARPVYGLLASVHGPLLLAARPILTSEGKGPARGTVIIGQVLDQAALAAQTRSRLSLAMPADLSFNPAQRAILRELEEQPGAILLRHSPQTISSYHLLNDVFGQPVLLLRVDQPRAILARGRAALRFATLSLALGGCIILLPLWLGLRRTVLAPLERLTGSVVGIGYSDEIDQAVGLKRRDEIGQLAREFKRMLERLHEIQTRLAEQAYADGVAEMARGVLHNIGNAVTPLNVKVSRLISALRQAPAGEYEQAAAQLQDSATPPNRQRDLSQFVELAGLELAAVVQQTRQELEQVRKQIDHIQLILADQQRVSRSQRTLTALDLAGVVNDSVGLLADELRQKVLIELDASLAQVGRVMATRAALQQVVTNLLINAAEAIQAGGPLAEAARITISASVDEIDGVAMAHLRFIDNGVGMEPETLARIFERDYSTKRRGSGLGLHWSANTVTALNGRLYAESAGRGQGAVMHLLLPLAPDSSQKPEENR